MTAGSSDLSRSGGGRFTIAPYASFSSAKLGQNKLDNPGDSVASSLQLGASVSGSIVPDTAIGSVTPSSAIAASHPISAALMLRVS